MLLRFWEGLLWSAPSRFCNVHKWAEWFTSSLPSSLMMEESSKAGAVTFFWLQSEEARTLWNLVVLSLPPCPDYSNCSSSSTQSEKESSRTSEGSGSSTSVSCLPLMRCPATIPMLSQRLKKDWCHSANSRSINHSPQWLSLQTPFLSIVFRSLPWSLLCPVSGVQRVKDNW